MESVDYDIDRTKEIIDKKCSSDFRYNNIFFQSNEYLNAILDNIDINDKNCLTVLASGDQAFHLYNRGAKSVDLFDINKLSIYYFYLRVWTINYYDSFYPRDFINKNFVLSVLKRVKPKTEDEQIAYDYWKKFAYYFEYYPKALLETLFIKHGTFFNNEIIDLKNIKSFLDTGNIDFKNIDISSDNISIDKKYDIIYVSNIIDYLSYIYVIWTYRDNLYKLLSDDGIIISSYVLSCERKKDEKIAFSRKFNFEELVDSESNEKVGYVYTKKFGDF